MSQQIRTKSIQSPSAERTILKQTGETTAITGHMAVHVTTAGVPADMTLQSHTAVPGAAPLYTYTRVTPFDASGTEGTHRIFSDKGKVVPVLHLEDVWGVDV